MSPTYKIRLLNKSSSLYHLGIKFGTFSWSKHVKSWTLHKIYLNDHSFHLPRMPSGQCSRISSATRLTFITYGYKINFQSVLLHIRPGLALINLLSSNNINMPILNIVLHTILIIPLERICLNIKTFHLEWASPLFSWPVCLIRLCYC